MYPPPAPHTHLGQRVITGKIVQSFQSVETLSRVESKAHYNKDIGARMRFGTTSRVRVTETVAASSQATEYHLIGSSAPQEHLNADGSRRILSSGASSIHPKLTHAYAVADSSHHPTDERWGWPARCASATRSPPGAFLLPRRSITEPLSLGRDPTARRLGGFAS